MTAHTESASLGYRPGLDGIRALAIGLVLLNHIGEAGMPQSWLRGSPQIGVDVFFALSGFLITRLMLDESRATSSISLRKFWYRRALRLLPLAIVVIVAVLAIATVWENAFYRRGADVSPLRASVAALTYHMNFLQMSAGTHHVWALTHTWSLSIEEQFYLLWPLVVVACSRVRRWPLATTVSLAAGGVMLGSAIVRTLLWDSQDHVYNGLDSRAGQLCAGALLAGVSVAWPRLLDRIGRFGWPALAMLMVTGLVSSSVTRLQALSYDAIAVCSVVAIAGVMQRGSLDRVMSDRVLVWIGKRSYGLYLIHYPVFLALTPERLEPLPHIGVMALRLAASVALAAGAHIAIERPLARLRMRQTTKAPRDVAVA